MSVTVLSDKSTSNHSSKKQLGMGPLPHANGVAFRVWAPNADSVSVVGDFNDWKQDVTPLEREDGGNWYVDVSDATPGQRYKFHLTNGDSAFDHIDPRVREVTNSVGEGIIHDPDFDWQDDSFAMPAWNEIVIYETHIGTFNRSDDDTVGTFDDYQKKFDHLRELGVNALQIMPVAEFAGDVSWGYNPAHPFAIESAYGGAEGFKRFVREAHTNGFAIILDVVYNHFGPSDLDLWQFDGWSENNKGGIYFYNDHRSSTPWGDTRPDYGRGEVRTYIRDNAMMWLKDYHVDGLRYDMTLYIRSVDGATEIPEGWGLTQWVNRDVHEFKPDALTVAEDLQNNPYLTKSSIEGGADFSTQWDAGFVHPIRDVLTVADDADRDMQKVCDALHHNYNMDAFQRVIYTESHDEVANGKSRVPTEIDSENGDDRFAQKRAVLGAALVMTAPGIPMLFQGQELLQDGWFQDTEELDWKNSREYAGIKKVFSDLVAHRLNRAGTTSGLTGQGLHVFHVNHEDKVIAFQRSRDGGPGDDTLVVANFGNRSFDRYRIGLPTPGTWKLRLNTDFDGYSEAFDGHPVGVLVSEDHGYDGMPYSAETNLGAYAALILSQDQEQ
ncbi:alpha-amylase family glycosyl hydrolase [Planctomycetes bacterium K23_9]|uniref:1,4-alpha-glucan branching enzyme n=1 Tax=Stieleria marina TaxID=1930275 RepID=A0A517NQ67_9BACT|nr:1,4-alpha-glucan branching enzyme GlgB [Planctomycetes bacterium K23_9]